MSRYINAKTIYASSNPNVSKLADAFHQTFRSYFQEEQDLVLSIEQYRIKWRDQVVYDNTRKNESIAFLFFKDGVGEISFQDGVASDELERFVDLVRNEVYNPSAHLDVVGMLWQAEFARISYRVFDESGEGAAGDGRGPASESREEPFRADDHPDPTPEPAKAGGNTPSDRSLGSLATHVYALVDRDHPEADPCRREQHVQQLLESLFAVGDERLNSWRQEFTALNDKNKLLWLMNIMLEFTQTRSTPSVVRDILDIIDRLVRYAAEEAHIPTLVSLLDAQRKVAQSPATAVDFQALPRQIEHELTNGGFLLSLGRAAGTSRNDVHEVLRYFRMIGPNAAPGVCEILATSTEAPVHTAACDALLAMAGGDVPRIVGDFNLDNPHQAKDAVYLLQRCAAEEIHPIVRRLVSSPDVRVREQSIEYLAHVGGDEAASLLCGLLEDVEQTIRVKTLAAVEDSGNPVIAGRVKALCFAEDAPAKGMDEMERLFRALGKLCGAEILAQLQEMAKTRKWISLNSGKARHKKLLAISALRYIPGGDALSTLMELARDGDNLVRSKALYVLKQMERKPAALAGESAAAERRPGT